MQPRQREQRLAAAAAPQGLRHHEAGLLAGLAQHERARQAIARLFAPQGRAHLGDQHLCKRILAQAFRAGQGAVERSTGAQFAGGEFALALDPRQTALRAQHARKSKLRQRRLGRFDPLAAEIVARGQRPVAEGEAGLGFGRGGPVGAHGERSGGQRELALHAVEGLSGGDIELHCRPGELQLAIRTGQVREPHRAGEPRHFAGRNELAINTRTLAPAAREIEVRRDGGESAGEAVAQRPSAVDLDTHRPPVVIEPPASVFDRHVEIGQAEGLLAAGEQDRVEAAETELAAPVAAIEAGA